MVGEAVAGAHALSAIVLPAQAEVGVEAAVRSLAVRSLHHVDGRKADRRQSDGDRGAVVALIVTWKEEPLNKRALTAKSLGLLESFCYPSASMH